MGEAQANFANVNKAVYLAEWEQFFHNGGVWTAEVDAPLLARRMRGNTIVLIAVGALAIAAIGGASALAVTGVSQVASYLLCGLLAGICGLMLLRTWWTRQRLRIAEASPNYLTVSSGGVRVADVVELPWALSIGLVVLAGRSGEGSGKQRLGEDLARAVGIAQAEVIIGLAPGASKPLRAAAGKPLHRLFEVIGDGGALRIPLDSVLSAQTVAHVSTAVQAVGPLAGIGAVGPEDISVATRAVQDLYLGKPIAAPRRAETAAKLIEAAVAATVASTKPGDYGAAATLFAGALAAANPSGLTLRQGLAHRQNPAAGAAANDVGQDPAPEVEPARSAVRLDELARAVLNSEGQRAFGEARKYLKNHGPEKFAQRYPHLDDGFSEDGPAAIQLLLSAGQSLHARTIGWCDWSGEDDPGQVLEFVEASCRNLWQSVPLWREPPAGSDSVITLLRQADEGLARNGQRLLLIDAGSDTYHFVPVKTSVFGEFAGRGGEGFVLRGVGAL